ncbi:MAG: divergent PAP2 family protein [Spirochaetales bacterium]|nr:divergent PAP2 family protein [Spirochaetales bacterium]
MFVILPKSLWIAVGVQVISQVFKFLQRSILEKRLSWRNLVTFGGMPSAHSAFVTALATAIAVYAGLGSDLFGLSAVFGAIVIFDAYKLRGNVEKQAKILNRVQAQVLLPQDRLVINEHVGHTFPEIVAGIVFALVLALPAALLWK